MAATLITTIHRLIGTAAERVSFSTTDLPVGSTFYETDTTLLKVWDLTTWQIAPAVSPAATGSLVRKTAAFTAGAGTGDAGTYALFTVTGAVKFSIIATCSETLVDDGVASLECGVAGTTAGIIAQIVNAPDLIAGEIWADATPTLKLDTLANSELNFVIADGADIFLTIAGANITDGTIDFNIIWWPLNSTGSIVAA